MSGLSVEEFLRAPTVSLSLTERQELRAFFASPLWAKVWKNALAVKPPVLVPDGNPQLTGILANNRLHQMQGWELFRMALISQLEDRVPKPPPPKDTYSKPLDDSFAPPKT